MPAIDSACFGEGFPLSLKLGFHGLNPHFDIAKVLIEETGVVVACLVAEVEQGFTKCCWISTTFNVGKLALGDVSTESACSRQSQALVLSSGTTQRHVLQSMSVPPLVALDRLTVTAVRRWHRRYRTRWVNSWNRYEIARGARGLQMEEMARSRVSEAEHSLEVRGRLGPPSFEDGICCNHSLKDFRVSWIHVAQKH